MFRCIIFFLFFFLLSPPLPSFLLIPEQKLPVQVADVDRVHVDDVEPAEPGQRQVLEQLASQPSGADNEHADVFLEHAGELLGGLESWRDDAPRAREEGVEGAPARAQGGRRGHRCVLRGEKVKELKNATIDGDQ